MMYETVLFLFYNFKSKIKIPHQYISQMKENEKKYERQNGNQQSIEISHNQTLTHLINESKPKLYNQNEDKNFHQLPQSSEKLLKLSEKNEKEMLPIATENIMTQSVFVRRSSFNPNQAGLGHGPNDFSKTDQKNFLSQHEQKETLFRSKTMIQNQKKYEVNSGSQFFKHKLPLTILDFIVKNAKLKKLPSQLLMKTQTGRMLGQMGLSKKLTRKYNTKQCQICQTEVPQKQFQRMTKSCDHTYCSSCLHQYVIYKINAFEAVQCPKEGCNQPLDQESSLYQQLPLQVRKKYKKLLQYEMIKEHPNRKLCPEQKCQGWIQINQQLQTTCNVCKKVYCAKCLLPHHDGDCDNKQLQFFQGTLHYRQCSKCKNVIEKSSGCIHMTCRCGYQFCYLCGGKWSQSHLCNNPDQQPLARQATGCCCCQIQLCGCDCDCDREDCCEDCCGNCLDRFCNACCCCCDADNECGCDCCDCFDNPVFQTSVGCLLRTIMIVFWIFVILPVVTVFDFMLLGLFWIGITFFTGITMYTCEYISELQGCCFIMAIIFYPFTAFIGITYAFRQVFLQIYVSHVIETFQGVCEIGHEAIGCDW